MKHADCAEVREQDLDVAIDRAIAYFDGSREPQALLWLEVMQQRFGIEQFTGALRRFDGLVDERPQQAAVLRVLRRMADRDNPLRLEDMETVSHPSDRIIVCALYCDRIGLPPSFPEVLEKAVQAGGYYLPHVLLAWIWIQQFDGELALPDGFMDRLYGANATIVADDPRVVTDLKLEAAAFLCLAGQGALVDDVFGETVVATQNDDGGWGKSRDGKPGSDWHATVLGLLFLLHLRYPAGRR